MPAPPREVILLGTAVCPWLCLFFCTSLLNPCVSPPHLGLCLGISRHVLSHPSVEVTQRGGNKESETRAGDGAGGGQGQATVALWMRGRCWRDLDVSQRARWGRGGAGPRAVTVKVLADRSGLDSTAGWSCVGARGLA